MMLPKKQTLLALPAALAALFLPAAAYAQQYPQQQQQYPQQQQQQPYYGPPPTFDAAQLENLVSRVALYSDPLLAQVLTASTYPDQIPQAASWAMAHRYLTGDALAQAIYADRLPWDPSVIALLPFPMVLDAMARDQNWTQQLGSAVLAARPEVMDAVQRMRQRALDAGYLRDTPQERVVMGGPGMIEIQPVDPDYYYAPTYNPAIVFGRPGRGYVGGVINFGPRISIGAAFAPWGWSHPALDWHSHAVIIDQHPWSRNWGNREHYTHSYVAPPRGRVEGPRVESHARAQREVRKNESHGHDSHDRDHHDR